MRSNQPYWLLAMTLLSLIFLPFKAAHADDLRSAVQNPISSLISLPFKFTFDDGAPNGDADILNVQPVVPITVGDWNLVNRAIIPLIDLNGTVSGRPDIPNPTPSAGGSGLGDINYSIYFSPVEAGKVIWGIGPSLNLPTASKDQLGSGKWSAGATAVALTVPKWGSMGILGRQLWSFAGDDCQRRTKYPSLAGVKIHHLGVAEGCS